MAEQELNRSDAEHILHFLVFLLGSTHNGAIVLCCLGGVCVNQGVQVTG